jgi:AcrR family transcriptional regulator
MNDRSFILNFMPKDPSPKGERSRQKILDAAYALFIEQGFAATSMRQIAERAGLALSSIYNHFPSKDVLFEVVILERHPFHRILPLLSQTAGHSAEEFVRGGAQKLVDELSGQPDFLNLMLVEMVEFKGLHTARLFEVIFPQVSEIGARFYEFGGLRNVPPLLILRAFLGMFFSYTITGLILGSAMPPEMQEGSLDRFVDIFLHGILKQAT